MNTVIRENIESELAWRVVAAERRITSRRSGDGLLGRRLV